MALWQKTGALSTTEPKDLAWQLHETHLINVFLIPFVQCTCMWAERKSSDKPLLVLSLPEQLSL